MKKAVTATTEKASDPTTEDLVKLTRAEWEKIMEDGKVTISDAPRIFKILQSFRAVSWTGAVAVSASFFALWAESKENWQLVAAVGSLVWGLGMGYFDSQRKIGS